MRPDELFTIDVASEVETLCGAQLQGPWQVPTELVRLANVRGAARVEIDRVMGGFEIRCDGVLADADELRDLVEVFDSRIPRTRRQAAIGRVEAAGLSALLWSAGLPGASLTLETQSAGWMGRLRSRGSRIELGVTEGSSGPPSTVMTWRCRGLEVRRAVAWLRTALRFVPIPVVVSGHPVERGFPEGLYRMRVHHPLEGEIAITASGDAPRLWLLVDGVLSARAVVPGYPCFAAAIEMGDRVTAGASADELRAAANPYLDGLIDEATRMLLLLVDRLPSAEEAVRRRLSSLMLRSAVLDLRRDQLMTSPIVRVREAGAGRMESPASLVGSAMKRGGVLDAMEPGTGDGEGPMAIEATTEERGLLAELLDIRIETLARYSDRTPLGSWILDSIRRGWRTASHLWSPGAVDRDLLSLEEQRLVDAAAAAGVDLALCPGETSVRKRGSLHLVGRRRPEVVAASRAVGGGDEWLYPALLAVVGEISDVPDRLRDRWFEAVGLRG